MTAALERRYRRLLRLYPKSYRDEHGPEMLDCLLEGATAGQRVPSPRETAALVTGGLHTRALAHSGPTWRQVWTSGLRAGAFLSIGVGAGFAAQRLGLDTGQ